MDVTVWCNIIFHLSCMGREEKAQGGLSKYFLDVFDESVRMFNTSVRTALGGAETLRGQWSL